MIKQCPFCGKVPEVKDRSASQQENLVTCKNENCVLWGIGMSQTDWERRPLEDKMQAAVLALAGPIGKCKPTG